MVAAWLAPGESVLTGFSLCEDTEAAIALIRSCGAEVTVEKGCCRIHSAFSRKQHLPKRLFCGESGLLARSIIPVASVFSDALSVVGTGSLLHRPMEMMEAPLKKLGGTIFVPGGRLPAILRGPIHAGELHLDGIITSQLLTGLLMALPLLEGESRLYVGELKSRQYVDITLKILHRFGIRIERDGYRQFVIPGGQNYQPATLSLEGDWSAAALLLVAGAVAGEVSVSNLNTRSLQPDRAILHVLELVGATPSVTDEGEHATVSVQKARLEAFEYDAGDCPDLVPALAALAVACHGVSKIHGMDRLQYKESNRGEMLLQELVRLGVPVYISGNTMTLRGGTPRGGSVHAQGDHRIAMALGIVGLIAEGPVEIDGSEMVSKSYPGFWKDLFSGQ